MNGRAYEGMERREAFAAWRRDLWSAGEPDLFRYLDDGEIPGQEQEVTGRKAAEALAEVVHELAWSKMPDTDFFRLLRDLRYALPREEIEADFTLQFSGFAPDLLLHLGLEQLRYLDVVELVMHLRTMMLVVYSRRGPMSEETARAWRVAVVESLQEVAEEGVTRAALEGDFLELSLDTAQVW